VSLFDFADVPVIDGVNHPADHGRGYEIVGLLRFIRTEDRSARAKLDQTPTGDAKGAWRGGDEHMQRHVRSWPELT
jgi:hypothetical protein